ncbi:MAG: DUF2804 domain-containing protein [Archangiaceae bacterium]|nr:DUF2804 domain-containing protein [Archangiaceae bacterium]
MRGNLSPRRETGTRRRQGRTSTNGRPARFAIKLRAILDAALPQAPASVADELGEPRFGTYQGGLDQVDLTRLGAAHRPSRAMRPLRHKRWLYSFISTAEVIAIQSVADLTYTANAFTVVVDLKDRRVLVDESWLGLPGPFARVSGRPGAGLDVKFVGPTAMLEASRPSSDDRYHLSARVGPRVPLLKPKLEVEASLLAAGAPPPLTVIAPVNGDGTINVTQKWAGMLAFGNLYARGRRFVLDGGVGGLDYTHGYLARRTAWRWAFMCGRLADGSPVGLNLVEGFNETRDDVNENALWLGGKVLPLSRARFSWNKSDPLQPWSVETHGGEVKLGFTPIGAHSEERDLKVVKSHFVQPVGLFSGSLEIDGVRHEVRDMPGVTEDQDILW